MPSATITGPAATFIAAVETSPNVWSPVLTRAPQSGTYSGTIGDPELQPDTSLWTSFSVSVEGDFPQRDGTLTGATIPAERLAVLQLSPSVSSSIGLPTTLPAIWRSPLDPGDTSLYAADFTALVAGGTIDSILSITVDQTSASIGLGIGDGELCAIVDRNASRIGVWLDCNPSDINDVRFSNSGIWLGVTIAISVQNSPAVYERTIAVNVRQL